MWKNADCCFGVDKEQPSRQHVADVKQAVRGLDIASEGVEEGEGFVDGEDEDEGDIEHVVEGNSEGCRKEENNKKTKKIDGYGQEGSSYPFNPGHPSHTRFKSKKLSFILISLLFAPPRMSVSCCFVLPLIGQHCDHLIT